MSLYPSVAHRRLRPELMDDPKVDPVRHRQALRGLARINFWSRSAEILWRPLCELYREIGMPLRVLDLACGGGDVLCRLASKANRAGLEIEMVGCDKSATAIEYAKNNARRCKVDIDYYTADVLKDKLPGGFDVVMNSLFLHHLSSTQAVQFLQAIACTVDQLVLVNDLRRTEGGLLLAHVATRLLTQSPIVHFDGPRSVEGAFTTEEMKKLTADAGLDGAVITRCWPQRFLLTWRKHQ